jgi:hypothetical protein
VLERREWGGSGVWGRRWGWYLVLRKLVPMCGLPAHAMAVYPRWTSATVMAIS